MEPLLYCCCGFDVHRDVIEACILRGADAEPEIIRQSFGAVKPELQRLMNWLSENGCYTVAMESTGVYWKPVFQTLESVFKTAIPHKFHTGVFFFVIALLESDRKKPWKH